MEEFFNDINSMEGILEDSESTSFTEEITDLEYREIIGEEGPISDKELVLPDIEEEVLEEIYKKTGKKKPKKKNKKRRTENNVAAESIDDTKSPDMGYGDIQHPAEEITGTSINSGNIPSKKDIILQRYNLFLKVLLLDGQDNGLYTWLQYSYQQELVSRRRKSHICVYVKSCFLYNNFEIYVFNTGGVLYE